MEQRHTVWSSATRCGAEVRRSGSTILLTKTTAARKGVALSYRSVHGLYFLAVVFATTIYIYIYILTVRVLFVITACNK